MESLNPEPTVYGTGAIDDLVAPDGSTELSRALAWYGNRIKRLAFGSTLRIGLIGDPIAYLNLASGFQPILDSINDLSGPADDWSGYRDPSSNWSPNP